jgi:hypothetical protein
MTDDQLEAFSELERARTGTDRFGVPHTLMGLHDEDFFAVLGRIVPLCALLENHLLTVCQGLTGSGQHEHTRRPVSKLIELSQAELVNLTDDAERDIVASFLRCAAELMVRRNDYIHSLWPAQGGETLFAWRASRDPTEQAAMTLETSLEEMAAYLASLISALDSRKWHRVEQIVVDAGVNTSAMDRHEPD